ncbi:MAG TPA: L,D-transpeptidase family protein [Candidatus Hydrogenedentes bacterium]|nr:L,D-transpeptidase family protein [Candidatus Hydrogenedentota bacterium]
MISPSLKHKKQPSITKYVVTLLAIGLVVFLGYRGVKWVFSGGGVQALTVPSPTTLDTARALLESGKSQEAREALRPLAEKSADAQIAVPALMMLADLDSRAGDKTKALASLKRITTDFASSADKPRAEAMYAKLLEEEGRSDEALAVYESIRNNAPAEFRAPALLGIGRKAERDGKIAEAHSLYAEAVQGATWDSKEWNEALDALGASNVSMVFSPNETPESKVYTVAKGDTLTTIGIKLNTTMGMLIRANGLTEDARLNLNQRLKWTPKDFRIVIERSKCRLFVLDSDGIFKRYYCGLGKPGHETTIGVYKIGNKEKDPVWHKPGEGPIPAGDPRNLLGTRWMPLVPVQEGLPKDLGIHGAPDPSTVGSFTSNGCARMKMEEVEELYDLVVRSTPVQIVESIDPATINALAIAQN